MLQTQAFQIVSKRRVDNVIGGYIMADVPFRTVQGYIDMITGTDIASHQNAIVQESSHYLILPKFVEGVGVTDDMEVIDSSNNRYIITYVDDPVGAHHHWEIYLTFKKGQDGNTVSE